MLSCAIVRKIALHYAGAASNVQTYVVLHNCDRDCSALCPRQVSKSETALHYADAASNVQTNVVLPSRGRKVRQLRAPTLLMHPYYYILMELSYFSVWIFCCC